MITDQMINDGVKALLATGYLYDKEASTLKSVVERILRGALEGQISGILAIADGKTTAEIIEAVGYKGARAGLLAALRDAGFKLKSVRRGASVVKAWVCR